MGTAGGMSLNTISSMSDFLRQLNPVVSLGVADRLVTPNARVLALLPVLWCPSPPPLVWPIVCLAVWMDPSMNIDSLLTAARLLDKGQLLTGLHSFNLAALPSAVPMPTSLPHIVPDVYFTNEFQENLQPGSTPGKMKTERKSSSASSASSHGSPYVTILQRKISTKSSRAAHNELEKTRRANLRTCLEKLKTLVPPVPDAARNTTLALLTRARDHIQFLDVANEKLEQEISEEKEKNVLLLAKLEQLRAEKARQEESVSTESSQSSRVSPIFLEYSPSTKPVNSPRNLIFVNPFDEGLLPSPILLSCAKHHFRNLNPLPASQNTEFLPIHLSI